MKKIAEELCRVIYTNLSPYHVYPALTGGVLYKTGTRKDIDIILYRGSSGGILGCDSYLQNAFNPDLVFPRLADVLQDSGLSVLQDYGRVIKCEYKCIPVDIILPEAEYGNYEEVGLKCSKEVLNND